MEKLWNEVIAPEIRSVVVSVWRGSRVGNEVEEAKVINMALHVVLQRSLVPGLPLPPSEAQLFLSNLEGGIAQVKDHTTPTPPKTLPLKFCSTPLHQETNIRSCDEEKESANQKPPPKISSPTSPEWNEANLAKILGLSPMGYA